MTVYADENKFSTRRMVLSAVFCAMAYAVQLVFRIQVFGFLTFDAKDAILTLGAMVLGPVTGMVIAVLVALIEMISVSSTGFWGFLMNAISSAVFAGAASAIYRRKKTLNSAIIGLLVSVLSMTAVMIVMNIFITPIYSGMPTADVIRMIPSVLLPFNLTKAIFNAALVMVLYKPITVALRRIRVVSGEATYRMNRSSVLILVIGGLVIAACVAVFFLCMNGKLVFGGK